MKRTVILFFSFFWVFQLGFAQKKVLFDASKAETAGNADWIIDADQWNLGYSSSGYAYIGGGEANAQRYPTPDQSGITSTTTEDYWKGALSAWGVELVQAGYQVETLPYDGMITYGDASNPQDLSNYDMYVVCEPNFPFTDAEKEAIINYVYNGGVLFMIADHANSDRDGDGWDSPDIWNDLMSNNPVKANPFGITFDYEYFDDASSKIINDPDNPVLHGVYGDVTQIEYYGGTSMTIEPDANPNVKALIYRGTVAETTGNTNILVAMSQYGRGLVFAFGDSSPFDDGTGDSYDNLYDGWYQDANGNHRVLIMNASIYALERTITAVDGINIQNQDFIIMARNGQLQVSSFTGKEFSVRIFSLTGSLLHEANARGRYTKKLPGGVYIVNVVSQGRVFNKKVIVF